MKHQKTFETLTHLAPLGALVIALNAIPVDAQGTFTTIDYPGATNSSAQAVNNAGLVVGAYTDASDTNHGFQFDGTNYTSIDFPGASGTAAADINNAGKVVGTYTIGSTSHGFWLQGSKYNGFDVPGASTTAVLGINDADQLVGVWQEGLIASRTRGPWIVAAHGYQWDPNGTLTNIDVPSAIFTIPSGINNAGQIVGTYIDSNFRSHGFLLDGGSFSTIDAPDASETSAMGINNLGPVVVGGYTDLTGSNHGFVLQDGTFTTLDVPVTGGGDTAWHHCNDIGFFFLAGAFEIGATGHGVLYSN